MKKPTKTNLLRIDLDLKTQKECIELLWVRLAYLNDIDGFHFKNIEKICIYKKKSYNCKIWLKNSISVAFSIHLEMILGDDWRRNINVLINYHKLNMQYYDRIFDIKLYPNGKIRNSKEYNITKVIKSKVLNRNRGIYFN